ncbi:MAG: shikimate kinase [Fuerstiella sp.]
MIVTLIGYRGCGKSTVGPLLADRLGYPCVDSDDLIESRARKSIRQIFAEDGEPAFRQLEADVLAELTQRGDLVIAAGGGAILAEANRRRLKAAGPVVWLSVHPDILAARIEGDLSSDERRPSLTGRSVQDEVAEVLETRLPLYQAAAAITVSADTDTPEELAERIFRQITAGEPS